MAGTSGVTIMTAFNGHVRRQGAGAAVGAVLGRHPDGVGGLLSGTAIRRVRPLAARLPRTGLRVA